MAAEVSGLPWLPASSSVTPFHPKIVEATLPLKTGSYPSLPAASPASPSLPTHQTYLSHWSQVALHTCQTFCHLPLDLQSYFFCLPGDLRLLASLPPACLPSLPVSFTNWEGRCMYCMCTGDTLVLGEFKLPNVPFLHFSDVSAKLHPQKHPLSLSMVSIFWFRCPQICFYLRYRYIDLNDMYKYVLCIEKYYMHSVLSKCNTY